MSNITDAQTVLALRQNSGIYKHALHKVRMSGKIKLEIAVKIILFVFGAAYDKIFLITK
jgi:hypothetical protein